MRILASSYGMAHALAVSLVGSSEDLLGDFADPMPWAHTVLFTLSAGVAGLLVAVLLLRMARRALEGGFFARYGVMALAVCTGGALVGGLVGVMNLVFFVDASAGNSAISLLIVLPYLTAFGGLLGLAEGLLAAVPLAGVLGLFRPWA